MVRHKSIPMSCLRISQSKYRRFQLCNTNPSLCPASDNYNGATQVKVSSHEVSRSRICGHSGKQQQNKLRQLIIGDKQQ
eukprot:984632-Pelagomonas_calceolata.AAC.1